MYNFYVPGRTTYNSHHHIIEINGTKHGTSGCAEFAPKLTVQHLRGHPVGVPHHSVAFLAVDAPKHPLFGGGLFDGLDLLLYDEAGQPKVGHHHSVVLL